MFFSDGKYSFDFSELAFFLDFATAHGIEYFEFAHLFTQWGAEYCPKVIAEVDGERKRIFGWDTASESEDYKAFLTAYLPALTVFLRDRGQEKISFIHLSDEPREEHVERYKRLYRLVKPLIGEMQTFDALSEYAFYQEGAVDIPVVLTSMSKPFVDRKVKHLAYYCCTPCNFSSSNRFFAMPSERTRAIGVQIYENCASGFLHWGYNFYNTQYSLRSVDPYEETDAGGKFPSGDSYIVYPAEGGVNRSLRFYTLREAFDDYRALLLLERVAGEKKARALLKKFGVYGYNAYPHSGYLFKAMREEINRAIERGIKRKK